jgi:hypothetical protein
MDGTEFIKQIKRAWTLINVDLKIGRTLIWPYSLTADEEVRKVAFAPDSSYAKIYKVGLSQSAYNFLLRDYSYFQFSWESECAWRMAYLPNPWITGVADAQEVLREWEALVEMGELSHEDTSDLIDELPYSGAVPPIRFEYSLSQYREIAHPAAHFHVGRNSDNRWPCALLLGPFAFCMMITRLYYPDQWRPRSSFEGGQVTDCLEFRFAEAIQASQFVHEFSATERRMLHLGRNMMPIEEPRDHEARSGRARHTRRR